ncbi:MAG: molybdenum cofactor biosynthesis protein MoaE [Deltaproteobacteria bacterium]|nr:molybdenum cofactor biosynthesis protein MoaE [Deltaproteobacteria bacterium]
MRLRLRAFAVVRELLGRGEETLEVPDGTRVGQVLDLVAARDPRLGRLRPLLRAARNQALAGDEVVLAEGDEVALIPPVAGGAPQRFRVQATPVDPAEAQALVARPGAGAIVSFVGTVRDEHDGHPVERLEYEAYVEMAEKVLVAIGTALEADMPGVRLAVIHRHGDLHVGEVAVAIAAAAPHRAQAFDACREAIERVKRALPVWKKEHSPDGAVWLGTGS